MLNKRRMANIKSFFIYLGIFISVLLVSTLALSRKINRYKTNFNGRIFQIEKEVIVLTNPSGGRIERVLVSPGQHVKAGDVLIELSDEAYSTRLSVLEEFSNTNVSARTEAELLRLRRNDYIIVAPRDGIVKEIELAMGSVVPPNTKLVTLYGDEDAKLITLVDSLDLDQIQKTNSLEVYNRRLEQGFFIELAGISEVVAETDKYKVIFEFTNPENSAYFVNGESVETVPAQSTDIRKPADVITDIWNGLIIQERS